MAITITLLESKLGNIQSQLEMMRREFDLFRGYVNKHFDSVYENMATKADVYRVENRVDRMAELLVKVAQKVGVKDIQNLA